MEQTAQGLYAQLEQSRSSFLKRGQQCSRLTLPSLLPEEGHSGHSELPTPFQGIGARGVNNLASKLLLALFPPNTPFFRYSIDDRTLQELGAVRSKVEDALASRERTISAEIEGSRIRIGAFEALKQLLVAGNVLAYLPDEGGLRVYPLSRYVVQRDAGGNVLHIIAKDSVSPLTLPEELQASAGEGKDQNKNVDIYTHIARTKKGWKVYQEVKGVKVAGTVGTYPLNKCPYIPLRWTKIDGEDYGRGIVEEYLGDLISLEGLTQAIVEGSAAAAKVLFLVNPNGTTDKDEVATSENGAMIEGNAADVTVLQMQKFNDFRVALETAQRIESRLAMSFLLNSAIQRNGERVTAEEIRFMAGELEDAMGGSYSIMSQEFQLPLINRIIYSMERQGRLDQLPEKYVRPVIVTGLEALGRGHDLNKLNTFLQQLAPLGPEVLQRYMNIGDYITRVGTSLGIDMQGLVKSEEQLAQEDQAAQEAMMQQQMMATGMDAGGKMAVEATKGMMNGASQEAG
jgi:hypothetical protein